MIIIRLMGGIGNQIFQYAAAFALAKRHNSFIIPEISFYDMNEKIPKFIENADHLRELGLNEAQIKFETIQHYRLDELAINNLIPPIKLPNPAPARLKFTINGQNQEREFTHFNHTAGYYNPEFTKLPDNVIMTGYFESPYYCANYMDEFKSQLVYKGALSPRTLDFRQKIMNCEFSVGLSVRLGDKNNNPIHGVNYQNYVMRAIALCQEFARARQKSVKIFIFCADKANFMAQYQEFNDKYQNISEYITTESAYFDFELLKCPDATIMTNSTFAWWAGQCNAKANKLIIAPNNHYLNNYAIESQFSRLDYYPDNFILLPISRLPQFQ